jgi:hypothetical protein
MSRWIARGLILLLTAVLAVGASEAALWVIAPVPYDEWMVYENEGHIRYRAVPNQLFKNRFGSVIRINKDGFRGPDYSYDKPAGTLRVVVHGESSAFCYNSGEAQSWPGALQIALEQGLKMPVQVINLALPGYDIFDSKINYLAYGRAFHPDAILVYDTWNDMKNFRELEEAPYHPHGPVQNKPLWQRFARATQIGRRARNVVFTMTGQRMETRYRAQEGKGHGADRPVDPRAFSWEERSFRDLVMLAQTDGVLPILVSQATLVSREAMTRPEVLAALGDTSQNVEMTLPLVADTWLRVSGLIEQVAKDTNAIFIDGYAAVPHDVKHLEDHVHLWDAGSARLAAAIAEGLLHDSRFLQAAERAKGSALAKSEVGQNPTRPAR